MCRPSNPCTHPPTQLVVYDTDMIKVKQSNAYCSPESGGNGSKPRRTVANQKFSCFVHRVASAGAGLSFFSKTRMYDGVQRTSAWNETQVMSSKPMRIVRTDTAKVLLGFFFPSLSLCCPPFFSRVSRPAGLPIPYALSFASANPLALSSASYLASFGRGSVAQPIRNG